MRIQKYYRTEHPLFSLFQMALPCIYGYFCLILLLAGQNVVLAKKEHSEIPPHLDEYVARTMKTFEVPGVSIATVKDDVVVIVRGFGVKRLGNPAPVDEQTLFGIASNTKAFTATALSLLVEEGKIEWDAPVIRYLPWFQMWDPYVTRELTIRDLLVHRSGLGLGAGDLLWWPASTYNRHEVARQLQFLRPLRSFRSAYAYDNVLYLVAGEVIEAISGQSWEDFVTSRILARMGMTGSNVRPSAMLTLENVAIPHASIEGKVRPVAPLTSDTTNPAGGINSNAEDMAKWLRVQLARGLLPDGSRLFSEETSKELTTIVTPIAFEEPPSELASIRSQLGGYALGFGIRDYHGHKIITHTGGLPGYVSRVMMIPEINLGIAILTNQESLAAFDAIAYWIVDYYLGLPATDWIEAYRKAGLRQKKENIEAQQKEAMARDKNSHPSLPLTSYVGSYGDAWYGDIDIKLENNHLVMQFTHTPQLEGDLEHFQYDTFIARWRDRELRADAYVTFALNPDGSVDQVKMRAISRETDFSFDFHDLLLKPVKQKSKN